MLPVATSLDEFKVAESPIPAATFARLGSLEWIRARENLVPVRPSRTSRSQCLIGLGETATSAALRVRDVAAALVEALYRGLADNSGGRFIGGLLRADLAIIDERGFAPPDATGSQLLFRFVAAADEGRSLGIASHWPFEDWGASGRSIRPPWHSSTGSSTAASPSCRRVSPSGRVERG